jgi:hypothetical protein
MRPSVRRDVVVCVLRSTSQQQTFELSFSHHSPPLPPEHINDEIDETNIFVFGLQWVFVPEYTLYQVGEGGSGHEDLLFWIKKPFG